MNGSLRRSLPAALFLLLVPAVIATAQPAPDPLVGLDDYVQKAMQDWGIPGLAIAIVKDDKAILAKGCGVRELGKPDAVDENTVFAIGSNTKAFTALALGLLVQDKKIGWDDHVTDYLKSFQLAVPWVTREITVRDLLCHRSGLKAYGGDMLWCGTDLDRNEIIRRARFLKPVSSFRSEYAYQNIMYLAAGQIIPAVAGKSWDDFIKERLLVPLEMKRSSTSVRDLKGLQDTASPHSKIGGKAVLVPYRNADNIAPAGAINSSAADMVHWLRLQLGNGVYNGTPIADPAVIAETRTPQTPMRLPEPFLKLFPSTHFMAYGLGWVLQDYHGRLLVWHTGGIDGMLSLVAIVPEERLGLVILTNYDKHALHTALFFRIADAFLGQPAQDWSALSLERHKKDEARQAEQMKKIEQTRIPNTRPTLPLAAYVGEYEDDFYGKAQVTQEGDHLVLCLSSRLIADLAHWHYDTFRLAWRDPVVENAVSSGEDETAGFATFALDAQGKVTEMKLGNMAVFKRAPEPRPTPAKEG